MGTTKKQGKRVSQWERSMHGLSKRLKDYRRSRSGVQRRKAQDLFYESFRRLTMGAAVKTLSQRGWQGDLHHDAEEVTSECLVKLLRQEERWEGAFSKPSKDLPGYLSGTIWNGVTQRINDRCDKDAALWEQLPLDYASTRIADTKVSNTLLRISMKAAIEKLAGEERRLYKLPVGVIPLDCVLDRAVATGIVRKVPKRTWQRYVKQSRIRLGERLGIW